MAPPQTEPLLEEDELGLSELDPPAIGLAGEALTPQGEVAQGVAGQGAEAAAQPPPPWLIALRAEGKESQISPRQRQGFLAAVELDEARPRESRLGYLGLYKAYLSLGHRHWLDPSAALKPLSDCLLRYSGDGAVLGFIIDLCMDLARANVAPDAFIRHVILPRLANDSDWRRWPERHAEALGSLARFLIQARTKPPFDAERLGQTEVLSDLALCKYLGQALCRMPARELRDRGQDLAEYLGHWASFTFESRRFLCFLRRGPLAFLYRLGGRVDLVQLIAIIKSSSELERPFSARVDALDADLADRVIRQAEFYRDLDACLERRRQAGSSWTSLARELRAYLDLIKALLGHNAGPSLFSWFASLMGLGRAELLEDCARMLSVLRDTGGLISIHWHTLRLRALGPTQRQAFIDDIAAHGGLAADYAHRDAFLPYDPQSRQLEELSAKLRSSLNLAPASSGQDSMGLLAKDYGASAPERQRRLDSFWEGVLSGGERRWSAADIDFFDAEGQAGHELLTRRLIPSLGMGFSQFPLKAPLLAKLREDYCLADAQSLPDIQVDLGLFEGQDSAEAGLDALSRDGIRKRVSLETSTACLAALAAVVEAQGEEAYQSAAFAALGRLIPQSRRALEGIRDRALSAEGPELERLEKSRAKAQERLELLESCFELREAHSPSMPKLLVIALHASAHFLKGAEGQNLECLSWLARRQLGRAELAARLDFLRQDVQADFLSLEQLSYLVDTLGAIIDANRQAAELGQALAELGQDPQAADVLSRCSCLRGRGLGPESLDASMRRLIGMAKLEAEKTKWKELVDRHSPNRRRARAYRLRFSKCFLDAYYGDFGGICLSAHPELITRPGFFPIRLLDLEARTIMGEALVAFAVSAQPTSFGFQRYWLAFAVNPLSSAVRRWNSRQLLMVYLSFRLCLERLAKASGLPVLLAGYRVNGLASNNQAIQNLIVNYEIPRGGSPVIDARGFNVVYDKASFSRALLIIDPRRVDSFMAESALTGLSSADAAGGAMYGGRLNDQNPMPN